MFAASGILDPRGTWSSAKPSASSSLWAPMLSEGGARGLPPTEEDGMKERLGVAAERDGASDIRRPASLEGAMVNVVSVATVESRRLGSLKSTMV